MARLALITMVACLAGANTGSLAASVEVQRIWDKAPYNAFTDLARFRNRWYCAFREGQAHVSADGALRVIVSEDGETWHSAALVTYAGGDLRDGKLSVTPDGRLMLSGAVRLLKPADGKTHQSLCWTTVDGKTWSERQKIGDANYWLWSVTWLPISQGDAREGLGGYGYSFGYKTVKPYGLRLYQLTADRGKVASQTWADVSFPAAYPNETSLVFASDGTGDCLLRTEKNAWLGTSAPPYKDWKWKETNCYFGGPKMIQLADGRLLGGGRLLGRGRTRENVTPSETGIVNVDFENARLEEIVRLPSGGRDTSYPGMVVHEDTLWMSYYSAHEEKVCIYLARIPLRELRSAASPEPAVDPSIEIGSRRELFVDDYLIDKLAGAALRLHKPEPKEVVLHTDAPWEGNICAYFTVFQDGPLYRMYYRGSHYDTKARKATHPEVVCYAESVNGIQWTKPKLGLFEFDGSQENNIVWMGTEAAHNFTPFVDGNPDCPPERRYKAIGGETKEGGLYGFVSADGLRWRLLQDAPVFPGKGWVFDSQNLAFWDGVREEYRLYYRTNEGKVRRISTATSPDFIRWSSGRQLAYPAGTPTEHLYTNAILPYPRAPHILIGFPARFLPKTTQVEPLFMSSRDAVMFTRCGEPVIPTTAPEDRAGNRSNYMAWGLVQLPGELDELSVYATEAYYKGPDSRLRRFTYRVDGFVSAHARAEGGEVTTKPLKFTGERLLLNFATEEAGSVRVEMQTADGKPLPGFSLADAEPLTGDSIHRPVAWKGGADVSELAGRPIRLRFVIHQADVYSFQFTK